MKKLLAVLFATGATFAAAETVPIVPVDYQVKMSDAELYWNTPTGDLSAGEYGPDETGKLLWIFPATSTRMYKGDSRNDVSGLAFKSYAGIRYFNYTVDSKGETHRSEIQQTDYYSLTPI